MTTISRRFFLQFSGAVLLAARPVRAASLHKVSIANMAFNPAKLTIKAGDSVEWKNRDSAEHTATDKGKTWDTGILRRNKTSTIVFNTPGEFDYYCAVHPNMRGKITVT